MIPAIRLAFTFLTRLPLSGLKEYDENDFKRCIKFFPVVGLVIGAIVCLTAEVLLAVGAREATVTFIVLTLPVLITGGLHLDGLADTADGFWGGKDKERALAIMKDSSTGPFGMTAVTLVMIGKFSALWVILNSGVVWPIVSAFVLSRWAMAAVSFKAAYPRGSGTGKVFIGNLVPLDFLYSSVMAAAVCILFAGWRAILLVALAASVVWCVRFISNRKIGGVTGDVLGATNEVTELVILMFI
ncbi:MAG: adenosylcobinamide-GDP ribazoletransferase [bacterium]|nr:MAG: adenosylcobinamide-GDP ribazoletransferase [bacterium]